MTLKSARSPRYEVDAEFLQLTDDRGHRHFLKRGSTVPDWVPDDQVANLEASGAIYKYEVI